MSKKQLITGLPLVAAYVATIALANWLTMKFGLVPVGFGLVATAGAYVAGAAFVFRNLVQETLGRLIVVAAIVIGALVSWKVSSPQLAFASGFTFLVSETCDFLVYTPLRRRGWLPAAIAGNVVGAVVDTFLFLTLAGFPVLLAAPGQMVGKAYATIAYLLIGGVARRVVLRQPVNSAHT